MSDSSSALFQNRMVPFNEGLGREAYVPITLRARELLFFTKETQCTVLTSAKLWIVDARLFLENATMQLQLPLTPIAHEWLRWFYRPRD